MPHCFAIFLKGTVFVLSFSSVY